MEFLPIQSVLEISLIHSCTKSLPTFYHYNCKYNEFCSQHEPKLSLQDIRYQIEPKQRTELTMQQVRNKIIRNLYHWGEMWLNFFPWNPW